MEFPHHYLQIVYTQPEKHYGFIGPFASRSEAREFRTKNGPTESKITVFYSQIILSEFDYVSSPESFLSFK